MIRYAEIALDDSAKINMTKAIFLLLFVGLQFSVEIIYGIVLGRGIVARRAVKPSKYWLLMFVKTLIYGFLITAAYFF